MRLLFALLLTACTSAPPETVEEERERRVLVVGWDGVRADAATGVSTPVLDTMTVDAEALTQLTGPTSSGPGWMSVLTGVGPEKHGVVANGQYDDRDTAWATLASRARAAGIGPVLAAVHWPEILSSILESDSTDDALLSNDAGVAEWAAEAIEDGAGRVVITHFDDPDHAGHDTGFHLDNRAYVESIEGADAHLGALVEAIEARVASEPESWLVVVTTDHGGLDTGHGPIEPIYQQIFVAAAVYGEDLPLAFSQRSHLDVTPTALDWLGIDFENLDGTSLLP